MKYYTIVVRYNEGYALEKAFVRGCTREQVEREVAKKNAEAGEEKYFIREYEENPIAWMD